MARGSGRNRDLRDAALFIAGLGLAVYVVVFGSPFDPYAAVFLIVTMLGLRLIWRANGH